MARQPRSCSSTAYAIVATVPASATTGTVTVTNTNGSANRPQAFTVLEAPTMDAFLAHLRAQGDNGEGLR